MEDCKHGILNRVVDWPGLNFGLGSNDVLNVLPGLC